jgi:minor histocompatibility antigen H13
VFISAIPPLPDGQLSLDRTIATMDNSTMPPPEDLMARAAFYFEQSKPMIPLYIHLIVSALFPIVTGSFASLSRPSTAAKPTKKAKKSDDDEEDEDEDEDEDEVEHKMEGLSPRDAIVLPITAGAVLGGLYWLIKKYGAEMINLIFGYYFSCVGVFSVGKILNDGAALALSVAFPAYFAHKGKLYKVDGKAHEAVASGGEQGSRNSPLPGVLGLIPLPRAVNQYLWTLRSVPIQKYAFVTYIKGVLDVNGPVTLLNAAAGVGSLAAISYNHFIDKPWWLTNLQGFAVSYTALQVMSPTTFATGSLILTGLFFYDIWAVFFTPLMVTVAKNLDQPIKLLFPRPDAPGAEGKPPVKSYSMLGLGDIVLPGLMIGLALRFDLHMYYLRKQKIAAAKSGEDSKAGGDVVKADYHNVTGHWGSRIWTFGLEKSLLPEPLATASFPKPYFVASLVGYVAGMIATLLVMSIWQHAQPALLYLVPGILVSIWSTALVRGEVKQMWNYEEEVGGGAATEDDAKKSDSDSDSKDDQKSAESWLDYVKYEVVGLSRPSDNKSKDADVLKAKAKEDPDSIFAISIRRMGRSKKAQKGGDAGPSDAGSHSGSDDVVLVSKDLEDSAAKGATRRTRSKKG